MKRERSGVVILLMVLLIFSATVGMLHADKNAIPPNQKKTIGTTTGELGDLSPEQAIAYLLPLTISRSIEKIVDAFIGVPAAKAKPILAHLIDVQQAALTRDDLVKLLFGIVAHYKAQADKFMVLDLIADHAVLQQGTPLLYTAAVSPYAKVVPVIMAWIKQRASLSQLSAMTANSEMRAFEYAVTHNAVAALNALHEHGVHIGAKQATDLLWKAVAAGKKADIARFLIAQEHATVNDVRGGYTPLMQAAKHNQLGLVKALVEAGSDVNKLADPAVGTALQIAIERGYTAVELYLRDKGARE